MAFDPTRCNQTIADLNINVNNNLVNRDQRDLTRCTCGQHVHLHPQAVAGAGTGGAGLGAGVSDGRPKSPPYRAAVFILYYHQRGKDIVPLGTAVAITCRSQQILLTAGHCCFATANRKFAKNLFCTKSLLKDADGKATVGDEFFPVKIIYCTKQPDIGILHRIDGGNFVNSIPLCPRNEVPWIVDRDNWEVTAKCYHCPIDSFYSSSALFVSCEATSHHNVASASEHHFTIREEFLGGSSGGAWVLPRDFGSKLIGILISTESTPLVVDAITEPANPDGSIGHSVWQPSLTVTMCIIPSTLQFHNSAGAEVDLPEFIASLGF